MIESDSCMVLLKETLPDYYHQILFKIVKKLVLGKSKQGSLMSTSVTSGKEKATEIPKEKILRSAGIFGKPASGHEYPALKVAQKQQNSMASSENLSVSNS